MNLKNKPFYTATTLFNLEEVLAKELEELEASNIEIHNRAVTFEGDELLMYEANLWLRTAIRVLKPLHSETVTNDSQLYRAIYKLDWASMIHPSQTFMISSAVSSENFTNSLYASLKVKDAIVDKIRKQTEDRPNVDKANPDFTLILNIKGDQMTISLDTSGGSLHRRGYKTKVGAAPLSEVLAAGMILLSGWDKTTPLIDPMCGSGTLVTEAGLIAQNIAPGLFRERFGFEKLKNFDKVTWKKLKIEARKAIKVDDLPQIIGYDLNKRAVNICRENIENAGLMDNVNAYMKDFFKTTKEFPSGTLVINPPYNERLGLKDINAFYELLGDTFKNNYKDYVAWVLSGNVDAIKKIGLKTSRKLHLVNGKLPCKFHKFEMY